MIGNEGLIPIILLIVCGYIFLPDTLSSLIQQFIITYDEPSRFASAGKSTFSLSLDLTTPKLLQPELHPLGAFDPPKNKKIQETEDDIYDVVFSGEDDAVRTKV